jgi:PAS domain S-box-containing protein
VHHVRRSIDGPSTVVPSLRDTLLLRERALQATTVSVTICDARLPDSPIVWVNKAFTALTGYLAEDVIGRNPRFLQGSGTDPGAVAEMRRSVLDHQPSVITLLNYRADGSSFWNSVSTAPVFDADGDVIGYIGVQVDVSESVLARLEREERLRDEHNARLIAEKAQRTLTLLSDVNARLITCFELGAAMTALADVLVPRFADGCAIDVCNPEKAGSDQPERVATASTTGGEVGDPALLGRVLRTGRPVSVQDLDGTEPQWLLVVPLTGRAGVLGALTLVSVGRSRSFDDGQLEIALDIGRRAGLAIEWCSNGAGST